MGFPGEDEPVRRDGAPGSLRQHLQPPSGSFRVRFDRFSPYHQRPGEYGLKLRPAPAVAHVYPLPERRSR